MQFLNLAAIILGMIPGAIASQKGHKGLLSWALGPLYFQLPCRSPNQRV
jgi:hypothetical protein